MRHSFQNSREPRTISRNRTAGCSAFPGHAAHRSPTAVHALAMTWPGLVRLAGRHVPAKFVLILILMTISFSTLAAEELVLLVDPPKQPFWVGDYPNFTVTISYRGSNSVTLVEPGDGSECGWRTPVCGFSIIPENARTAKHPASPSPPRGERCGNINPFKLSEVFVLQPGQSRRVFASAGMPMFERPGRYRLVFYYQNIPDLKISGSPLGPHEKGALEGIRASTPCRLVSNEIVINVMPKIPLH
jgi:hypothetical protein